MERKIGKILIIMITGRYIHMATGNWPLYTHGYWELAVIYTWLLGTGRYIHMATGNMCSSQKINLL